MNRNQFFAYFGIILGAVLISLLAIRSDFSPKGLSLLIFSAVFLLTLIKPNIGLVIIIISMLFSPDISLAQAASRVIFVRVDDVFLLVVVLAWVIRSAFTKNLSEAIKTPLFPLFSGYILLCLFSSLIAAIIGKINFTISIFSTLKYAQYFIIFLMVRENLKTLRQAKFFVIVFLFVAFIVSVQANMFIQEQLNAGSTFFRVSPPIESRGGSEANTMGGYLLFMLTVSLGLFLYMRGILPKILLFILIFIMFRSFIYTLSRGSYLALIPAFLALAFISRKANFIYFIIVLIFCGVFFVPDMVKTRLSQTLVAKESLVGRYMEIEESPKERLDSWKKVIFEDFSKSPIIGHGVARRFIDGQVFTVLFEVGLLGLLFFVWILVRFSRILKKTFQDLLPTQDNFSLGLTAGFIAGFVGLIFHSLSGNTFIIIRVMEPFWFLGAIVVSLPHLLIAKTEQEI